jgi:tryptophan-rich sensory protein
MLMSTSPIPRGMTRDLLPLAVFLAICFSVAGLGAHWTNQGLGPWYDGLRKPSWTPPSWVFGPVWSVLYASMAVAAWLVWRRPGPAGVRLPLSLFAIQLALNLAWSGLFFALRRPDLAFGEILLLWAAILMTLVAFARASPGAAGLLVPYLAWVTYAAALNFAIWRLNP